MRSTGGCRVLKVLIAKDDLMIADIVAEMLGECGYEISGIGRTVAEAVALGLRHRPDLAVIDARMADDGPGTNIANELAEFAKLGILYVTGDAPGVMRGNARGHACLSKPYMFRDLVRSLEIVTGMVATGTASRPFPRGFRVLQSTPADPVTADG